MEKIKIIFSFNPDLEILNTKAMKQMKYVILFAIALTSVFYSCKQDKKQGTDVIDYDEISLNETNKNISSNDTVGEGLPIFYNMYLSVEMSTLFESVNANFNHDLLNKTDKVTDYLTSSKKALNLGVFAVDLSYARIFEQLEIAGRYFNSMQRLSEELGIPGEFFLNSAKRFERNINDKDSLIKIANEVYFATDSYLKENEQYNAAAQIILGGWIEAIYIASNVAVETQDIEIIERFAEQKYSLKNLLDMLSGFKDDEIIKQYVTKLKMLQAKFDLLTPDTMPEGDSGSPEVKKAVEKALAQIVPIKKSITEIRAETIE
ncbi:MAG: hypothetical protein JXB00_05310 [Bacteroidales bacterium]|nr:hypothetical protein [Bacteroidales bacterium]